ncbi:MAG: hypothetical protein WBN81_00340 [Gammaproteobacteria bacterium]
MNVYIKEWPNKTATILTANGQVIWTFSTVAEARQVCLDWHSIVYAGEGREQDAKVSRRDSRVGTGDAGQAGWFSID